MSSSRRNRRRGKKPQQQQRASNAPASFDELWKPVPAPDEPEPIKGVSDPSVVIDSLGTPPFRGQSQVAEHYFATVVERAAVLATALAQSADVLAKSDPDD